MRLLTVLLEGAPEEKETEENGAADQPTGGPEEPLEDRPPSSPPTGAPGEPSEAPPAP